MQSLITSQLQLVKELKKHKIFCHVTKIDSSIPVQDVIKKINPNAQFQVGVHKQTYFNHAELSKEGIVLSFLSGEQMVSRMVFWQKFKECVKVTEADGSEEYIIELDNVDYKITLICDE